MDHTNTLYFGLAERSSYCCQFYKIQSEFLLSPDIIPNYPPNIRNLQFYPSQPRQHSTHHILFSRKSTPMVFLYSAVKIPLQYFWIMEDLPTAPLPTMTTWKEIKNEKLELIYMSVNLESERCWTLRFRLWIVLYHWICWIHQKPFDLSLACNGIQFSVKFLINFES